MRRRSVVLILLVVATTAMAAEPPNGGRQADDPATELSDYVCMQCHTGTGESRLPLQEMLRVEPTARPQAAVGDTFRLELLLTNPWMATLTDFQATIDLHNASSIGFSSGEDPLLDVLHEGTINATYDADTAAGELPLPAVSGERSGEVQIKVPNNVTDLRITLAPQQGGDAVAPDLRMAVWPSRHAGNLEPWHVQDDAGPGAAEVLQLDGADVAALGLGNWTVQARTDALNISDPAEAAAAAAPQPFTVTVDAWFNTTGERTQVLELPTTLKEPPKADADDGVLDRIDTDTVAWTLTPTGLPGPDERIEVRFYVHHHFVRGHADPGANPDHGYFVKSVNYTVAQTPSGEVTLAIAPGAVAVLPDRSFEELVVAIGEIVGYTSGLLLIASLLSGGVLGKGSRRAFNALFGSARRRVAFHNILSYALTAGALGHTILFLLESMHHWTLGLIWGGLGILALTGLGVTGAMQVPLIRRFDYATWRWTHFALALAAVLFSVAHILLDGTNFADIQRAVGWQNPLQ